MRPVDYIIMAAEAVGPFLIVGNVTNGTVVAEWAEFLEKAGVTEQAHADELVRATIAERIQRAC
jgi:hypothetical protein